MPKICLIFVLCACVFGETAQLEVSAKTIQSNLKKGQTILSGDVFVTKGEDKLWADEVVIETNKKNQPLKYTASGNVRFSVKMPDKEMSGRAKKAIYDVQKDEYSLMDNAVVEEKGKKNVIRGNVIILNPTTEEAFIQGSKQKPSMLTFTMDKETK